MSKATIAKQLVLAVILTMLSGPLLALGLLLGFPAIPFMLSAITVGYVGALVVQGWARPGRVVFIGAAAVGCVMSFIVAGSLFEFITLLAIGIWIVRSIVSYDRATGWAFDAALIYGGRLAAAWVYAHTGVTVLALWTFLLVQALYPLGVQARATAAPGNDPFSQFDRSARAAEEALRRVVAVRG